MTDDGHGTPSVVTQLIYVTLRILPLIGLGKAMDRAGQ